MPTQLEDISNQVSQEKISNSRLRNEEMRRQMANPWSEKQETTSTGTQPTTPVNTGGTLASIYSGLKNNADSLGLTTSDIANNRTSSFSNDDGYQEYSSTGSGRMPTWAPGLVGMGAGLAGLGQYGGLMSAATNFAGGNTAAGLGGLAAWSANQVPAIKEITGLPSLAGTLASGLYEGKSWDKIANNMVDSAANTAIGKAIPQFGLANLAVQLGTSAYNAATDNNYGFSAIRGLRDLFNGGTVANNGFFKNFSLGNWAQPITSGNENYSPYGGAGYEAPRAAPIAVAGPTGTEATYIPTTLNSLMSGGDGGSSSMNGGTGYMANDGSYAYGSSNGTYGGYAPSGGYFSSGNSNYSPYGGSGYSSNSDSGGD